MDCFALFRLPSVLEKTGFARSTLYLRIDQGLFTAPVSLGTSHAVAWPASEVHAINSARIAGKSNDEIRALVVQLEAARKAAA